MKSRSPSVERICVAAVNHFAEHGYDGASLNRIAEQVGIRKASIYTHFSSKDALVREIFSDALAYETAFALTCFQDETSTAGTGYAYCRLIAERYQVSAYLRFLLRTAYLPPASLQPEVAKGYEAYGQMLRELFSAKLADQTTLDSASLPVFSDAYLGIVDSLHVELIYADEASFERRLKALWKIISDALTLATLNTQ